MVEWYHYFLSNRTQVTFNSVLSDIAVISTGVPRPCVSVSSPFLFTVYTNDCVGSIHNQFTVKFSDDTVIVSLMTRNFTVNNHKAGVERNVGWCDDHHLKINTVIRDYTRS